MAKESQRGRDNEKVRKKGAKKAKAQSVYTIHVDHKHPRKQKYVRDATSFRFRVTYLFPFIVNECALKSQTVANGKKEGKMYGQLHDFALSLSVSRSFSLALPFLSGAVHHVLFSFFARCL